MQRYKQSATYKIACTLHVNKLYNTRKYDRLPEDKPSASKHEADIIKIKILV